MPKDYSNTPGYVGLLV